MDLQAVAGALGGEVRGGQILAPGIHHSPRDRSLSVKFSPNGELLVHSFAGDDWAASKDYVRERLGVSRKATKARFRLPTPAPKNWGTRDHNAKALVIWHEAHEPRGTPVERYLSRRGITDIDEAAGHALRFHPSCPFAGRRMPCMVALVRDVVTDEPKAVHRTALTVDGQKAEVDGKERLALGPIRRGAVKLTPDESVTMCLGIAEGIETALSLQLIPEFGRSPVWSLINEGGLASLPVLPGVEALWVGVDHDPAGQRAANAVSHRWCSAGRETFLITPAAVRGDLNDIVREGRDALQG